MASAMRIGVIGDGRRSPRRQLRLTTAARVGRSRQPDGAAEWMSVRVHDLSPSGLLIETLARVRLGDEIVVDLPECEGAAARVIWSSGFFFGCQFLDQLPSMVVSASLLKSDFAERWAAAAESAGSAAAREPEPDFAPRSQSEEPLEAVRWQALIAVLALLWGAVIPGAFLLL